MAIATIQKIVNIKDVENSDFLQVCQVLNWQCIINKKENLQVGNKIVYIEIDTICPETEQFEFLRKYHFRVKTQKLRGTLSQGLIIPLTSAINLLSIGTDVSGILGIKKYEKPQATEEEQEKQPTSFWKKQYYFLRYNYLYKWFPFLKAKQRLKFPKEVSKTDETRVQNLWDFIQNNYKDKLFYGSFKLDGSSITLLLSKSLFGKYKTRVCSRNFELFNSNNEWYQVFKITNFEQHLIELAEYFKTSNITVQGEYIGKPQGNPYKVDNQIRLFNIYVNNRLLLPFEFREIVHILNIPHCPLYDIIKMPNTIEELLKLSETPCPLNEKAINEGIVWRCQDDGYSFKVVSNKYLLQEK